MDARLIAVPGTRLLITVNMRLSEEFDKKKSRFSTSYVPSSDSFRVFAKQMRELLYSASCNTVLSFTVFFLGHHPANYSRSLG